MQRALPRALLSALLCVFTAEVIPAQTPHSLTYAPGKQITLNLPEQFDINIAATGLKRVRFFAKSPDGRIFVTSMHDLSDNRLGAVYILEGWNQQSHRFTHITLYLDHLRNPNNLAFYTDTATKQSWLYLPLTDRLIRYKYNAGDTAPTSAPETLIRFPDYGLHYKYGGWHLTRTVAVAEIAGRPRIFVSVGSSCNYCREDEVLRASVVSMDPDGKNQHLEAQGLRNAVDMQQIPELNDELFATNMGDDHLGDRLPEDTFFQLALDSNATPNYGWPACYFSQGKPVLDQTPLPTLDDARTTGKTAPKPPGSKSPASDSVYGEQKGVSAAGTNLTAGGGHHAADPNANLGKAPPPLQSCNHVPPAYTTFAAHSSPLGFAYFGKQDSALANSFLVALHGASHPHIGSGFKVVRFSPADRKPQDFLTGFLTTINGKTVVHGRPCAILRLAPDTFLLSDDYLGLLYYIHPHGR
ncbi:PQQ-dependent sugar dehydrogenase [Occallatibacter savannae]|uniref:PQQ-dependent sugar dehydrogenase n=1 Tax=Occallatibacter savannae TaxID=1002691 RepID=UPI000D68590F|nr:glucose/sorbosone dehydrogenase [Occallatibacter savannae]